MAPCGLHNSVDPGVIDVRDKWPQSRYIATNIFGDLFDLDSYNRMANVVADHDDLLKQSRYI